MRIRYNTANTNNSVIPENGIKIYFTPDIFTIITLFTSDNRIESIVPIADIMLILCDDKIRIPINKFDDIYFPDKLKIITQYSIQIFRN